jgi:hypothetical protein
MQWGYSHKKPLNPEKFYVYRRVLKNHLDALQKGYPTCLCPSELQTILEDVQNIVGLTCCSDPQRRDLVIDRSNYDPWVLDNPGCVVYEDWEKSFKKACPVLGIKVDKVSSLEEITKLVYKLTVSTYDSCAVLFNIKAYTVNVKDNCFDVRWTSTPIECNLEVLKSVRAVDLSKCLSYGLSSEQIANCKTSYDLLIKETKCKMTFGTYIDLLSCHLTTEIISSLVKCGLEVNYDAKKLCPVLKIENTVVHLYDDLDLTNLTEDIFSCDFNLIENGSQS